MQPSAARPRKQIPAFINHTPRGHETISFVPPMPEEAADETMSPAGRAFAAGPLYTNAIMGQTPSAEQKVQLREALTTIRREDSILVEESENPDVPSRPDSFSIHHDCTDQAPYNMNTAQSLLRLPPNNSSRDLAYFLRTTGPVAPHRRPSKVSESARSVSVSKSAFRFLKRRRKQPQKSIEIQDAGGLLAPVEQKVSAGGSTYFALKVPTSLEEADMDDVSVPVGEAPMLSPSIVESRVSISFADSINTMEGWKYPYSDEQHRRRPPTPKKQYHQVWPREDASVGATDEHVAPIRPAASSPPTPEPVSAISMAESYQSDLADHPAKRSLDMYRVLPLQPAGTRTSSSLPLPEILSRNDESPVPHPGREKVVTMEHPTPRRLASHTVLLQRASSLGTSLYRRSFTESPGPPPPRSPLRPRRGTETIEGILASYGERGATPRLAPSIKDAQENTIELRPFKPTVVTQCSGPIKRPKSRGKNRTMKSSYQDLRREREERTRARKLRDRPMPSETVTTIESFVNAPLNIPRQRLRKARPHIQIPGNLGQPPLATRESSSASSNASWKNVTESIQTRVSEIPTQVSPVSNADTTGYTPVSPVTPNDSTIAETPMALSPVMLVAEEIPVPKGKASSKPAKIIVKDGKSYTPRPRSASIPRSAMKRRSRQGAHTTSRPHSPAPKLLKENTPPLPSPPPDRALPPTPPASGSERTGRTRAARLADARKELPCLPIHAMQAPRAALPDRRLDPPPYIITHRQNGNDKESLNAARFQARLEALEKQNALLSAALTAVLRTNGTLNAPLSDLTEEEPTASPTAWESRIARRSAASHAASSSQGSSNALDMYMNTRRGSRHGR